MMGSGSDSSRWSSPRVSCVATIVYSCAGHVDGWSEVVCRILMYADDVVLIVESMKEAMGMHEECKKALEDKG